MAHYRNTERLRALLKKHQSKIPQHGNGFSTFRGEASPPCSHRLTRSECTPLPTGSQRLLTCIPLLWLRAASFTLLTGLMFNIFFFTPMTIKGQRGTRCWPALAPIAPAPPPSLSVTRGSQHSSVNRMIAAATQQQLKSSTDAQPGCLGITKDQT